MRAFITLPMSLTEPAPVSAIASAMASSISSGVTAGGRYPSRTVISAVSFSTEIAAAGFRELIDGVPALFHQ